MSNNVKRRPYRADLTTSKKLRPRASRHGKPLADVYVKHWRTVETDSKSGEFKTVYHSRPMTSEEIQEARDSVLRASRPTNRYGKRLARTTEDQKEYAKNPNRQNPPVWETLDPKQAKYTTKQRSVTK